MKILLILLASICSIVAQINLKATAPKLPLSWVQATSIGFVGVAVLVLRAGFFSGLSLLMTWVCYKRFEFLELMVAQSVVFVLAILTSYYVFHEEMLWNRVGAVTFILLGIGLFYAK